MNFKRYIGAALAQFAFIFFYEWFVHGHLLSGFYHETPQVWRPYDEMMANMPFGMGFQLVLSAWTAFVFTQLFKEGGVSNGLRFGLYFGVFAGLLAASWYLWLPVPAIVGWSWFASGIVEWLGGGFILGSIYHE